MKRPVLIYLLAGEFLAAFLRAVYPGIPKLLTIGPSLRNWTNWIFYLMFPVDLAIIYGLSMRKEWGRILTVLFFVFQSLLTGFMFVALLVSVYLGMRIGMQVTKDVRFLLTFSLGFCLNAALMLIYLCNQKTRQYFQDVHTEYSERLDLGTAAGYAGFIILLGVFNLHHFLATH